MTKTVIPTVSVLTATVAGIVYWKTPPEKRKFDRSKLGQCGSWTVGLGAEIARKEAPQALSTMLRSV